MEWTTKMEGGGMLYLRDEGNYMYLEATRPQDGEGLYKVILKGLQGGQVLGTMTPSDQGLKLTRMVSRSTMGQWGCLPLTKVICKLSFPFQEEPKPNFAPPAPRQVDFGEIFETLPEQPATESQWELVPEPPPTSLYRPCPQPQQWMKDPVLASCFHRCNQVLVAEEPEGFSLAVPYTPQQEFFLSPIFCFAQPCRLQEKSYLLFSFRQGGIPTLPKQS